MEDRLTITDVAQSLKVTPRTIMRWEKTGKIKKTRRDWRGWRVYTKEDLVAIRDFHQGTYEYKEEGKMFRNTIIALMIIVHALTASPLLHADMTGNVVTSNETQGIRETDKSVEIMLDEMPVVNTLQATIKEADKYTLGPNDVISIEVRRHPEFTGKYAINSEGKIGYKYVGDILVSGLTKNEVKERISEVLSDFLINPEVDVQILAYLSKVIYVVGDVGRPGKFYMKGDTIMAREALIQAGLPTQAASLNSCRLITPGRKGKDNYRKINAQKLLYEGDLRQNLVMNPGDVLFVPATFIAKVIRVVSPVTELVTTTAGSVAQGAAMSAIAL